MTEQTFLRITVSIDEDELTALLNWHRSQEADCAAARRYADATHHKSRIGVLGQLLDMKRHQLQASRAAAADGTKSPFAAQ